MSVSPSFASLCAREVHDPRTTKPHILPLYLTSSYAFDSIDQGIDIFKKKEEGYVYGRYGNPTVDAVATKIAALETHDTDVEAHCIMTSSGMAAIHVLLLSLLSAGEGILTHGDIYGGSTELMVKVAGRGGIRTAFTDLRDTGRVREHLRSDRSIRVLFFETPANPTLRCVDIRALCQLARDEGVLTIVDNTFATPYLQQPFKYGADFIIHSTTKYLNGHGNSIAGALVGRDVEFMQTKGWETVKLTGCTPSPMEAWLVHQGMKTLVLRMDKHTANAAHLATYLEAHDKVEKVNALSLPSHPDHDLAARQMRGFGGMLSFEIRGGFEAALTFMRNVQFCVLAPTLGDVDTLILHPASMSHINVPREIREANGITDGLIRISVGIEAVEDIIADVERALHSL